MPPSPPVGGEGWGEAAAAPATLLCAVYSALIKLFTRAELSAVSFMNHNNWLYDSSQSIVIDQI